MKSKWSILVWYGVFALAVFLVVSVVNYGKNIDNTWQRIEEEKEEREIAARNEEAAKAEQKDRELEEQTKRKLTEDMLYGTLGGSIDIYGIKIKVSKPYEIKSAAVDKGYMNSTKVVAFNISVANGSKHTVNMDYEDISLFRDDFTHTEGHIADTVHANVQGDFMDRYIKDLDNLLNTENKPIQPGEKVEGVVAYHVSGYDVRVNRKEDTNFTLLIGVSGVPFINKYEKMTPQFPLRIDWDNSRLLFK